MEYVETEGETIDDAIENALKILGVERDRITVEILDHGKKGILGIGSKNARVRASLRKAVLLEKEEILEEKPAPAGQKISAEERVALGQKAKEVLAEILRLVGVEAAIELKPGETEEEIIVDVRGDHGGLLIGRKGQTLEALQYLLTRIVGEKQGNEGPQLVVDTENYRERRRKKLEDMALRLGEKAKRQRQTVSIDALSAADRRIVQLALQDDPWLTTRSLGKGAYRRLLIIPEGDRRMKDVKDQEKRQPSGKQVAKH